MPLGWDELAIIIVLAIVILGPARLPEYAAKLARGIRQLRLMADGARSQLREQMGPEFEDINWQQYDPRQYDPRKIVRDALREPIETAWSPVREEIAGVRSSAADLSHNGSSAVDANEMARLSPSDPGTVATPYDPDAT